MSYIPDTPWVVRRLKLVASCDLSTNRYSQRTDWKCSHIRWHVRAAFH